MKKAKTNPTITPRPTPLTDGPPCEPVTVTGAVNAAKTIQATTVATPSQNQTKKNLKTFHIETSSLTAGATE